MKINEKIFKSRNFLNEGVRGFLAVAMSLLMIPYGVFAQQPSYPPPSSYPPPQGNYPPPQANYPPPQGNYPPQQAYAPLGAEQLDQLVAPIALYPDSLVAQILTAATYSQQVGDANNWVRQTGGMPPEQRAAAADTMPWDPSVKALTAFPSVLDNMARNFNWTSALGNAYYNQPGDVMNAVQAMRIRAQQAGALRSDDHYRVVYDGPVVTIVPVNPAFVYVPYYNPWTIYGPGLSPWGGYVYVGPPRGIALAAFGIGFAAGISIGLFAHYAWGYHSWAPNWHGGVVVYNHNTYISRSVTVINRGNFGGYNRGVFEHAGPGVPNNFRAPVTSQSAAFHPAVGPGGYRNSNYANHPGAVSSPQGRQYGQPMQPVRPPQQSAQGRQYGQPSAPQGNYSRPTTPQGNYSRPTTPQNNYSRPTSPQGYQRPATPSTPQNYQRPTGGYNGPANRPQGNSAPSGQVHTQASTPVHQQSQSSHQQSRPAPRGEEHKR
jgi:hypothetical protein